MLRSHVTISLLVLLQGCSGSPQPPKAWAQTPEEATTLPVGTVVSVERESYSTGASTGPGTSAGVSGAVGPVAGAAAVALIDAFRGTGTAYRHTIRLKATGEVIYRTELALYKVGDCVAMRSQPELVVPALSGACN